MAGYLVLEGGAEFGGGMREPDMRAIELAGGLDAPICVLPTAAAPDHNHERAGGNALRWFRSLGARRVEVIQVIDPISANEPDNTQRLRNAGLIYLLGGFPRFLAETLCGSAAWEAAFAAYQMGAVLAGSSAGAMVLCEHYQDPSTGLATGLGLLPNACVLPHHNTFGKGWAKGLRQSLPDTLLIGIDEQTGMIDEGEIPRSRRWTVYGKGRVTLYRPGGETEIWHRGESFVL